MEKIRTINSYVAIELPYITKNEVDFLGGKLDLIQKVHVREKELSCSFGTILAVPDTNTDIHNHFVDADNTMMVGDKAFFDKGYTSVHGRLTKRAEKESFNLLFDEGGKIVILVPSRAVIMVKRGDEYIAQNDYVIGTLIDEPKSKFEIHDRKYKDRLKVVSSGNNVRYKKITTGINTNFKVEKGDIAIAAAPVVLRISDEYEKHDLYQLKQRQIIGTISHK